MLEKGLVMLIQSALGSPPMAVGGFLGSLPKDYVLTSGPAYAYKFITDAPVNTLNSNTGWAEAEVDIKCFAATASGVLALSNAIRSALKDFRGTLPDPDATFVDRFIRVGTMDFDLDATGRDYYRVLSYKILYANIN